MKRDKNGSNNTQICSIGVGTKGLLDAVFSNVLKSLSVKSVGVGGNRVAMAFVKLKGLTDVGM
jgi:hypothetical protein